MIPEANVDDNRDNAAEDGPPVQRPTVKRQPKNKDAPSNPSRRKNKGSLAPLLTKVSLEVLFEIFGHLRPLDLIHLSRTSKSFRQVLMHPSAIMIWRAARQNVPGLPDICLDLTEPEYADLMFGSVCHLCGRSPARKPTLYETRNRWCKKCITDDVGGIRSGLDWRIIQGLVPTERVDLGRRRHGAWLVCNMKLYHNVKATLDDLKSDPEGLNAFKEGCQKKYDAIKLHAKECAAWALEQQNMRASELGVLYRQRITAIRERLIGMGWTEVDLSWSAWERVPTAGHSKPLTESAWEGMKDNLVACLEKGRNERIQRTRDNRLTTLERDYATWLRAEQPSLLGYPSPVNFINLPAIKPVWSGSEDTITTDAMLECKSSFAQIILRWRAETVVTFISYLPDDLITEVGEDLPGSQKLDLAVSVFRCTKDHTIGHFFPRLLDYFPARKKAEATVQATPHQQELDWPRKGWYTFDSITSSVVRQILIACGANPSRTTLEQLDDMDPRVVCMTCATAKSPPSIYGPTMSWKRAMHHWADTHSNLEVPATPEWRALDAEEWAAFIDEQEKPALIRLANPRSRILTHNLASKYTCTLCIDRFSRLPPLRTLEKHVDHVTTDHKQVPPTDAGNTVYRMIHPNTPLPDLPPIDWTPKV